MDTDDPKKNSSKKEMGAWQAFLMVALWPVLAVAGYRFTRGITNPYWVEQLAPPESFWDLPLYWPVVIAVSFLVIFLISFILVKALKGVWNVTGGPFFAAFIEAFRKDNKPRKQDSEG